MPIETFQDLLDLYHRKFDPAKAGDLEAVVQLDITGEGGGQRILDIRDGAMTISEGTHAEPDITVSSAFDDWMKVNLGEVNPMTAMMTGKVKIRGSLPLAMKFQALFFS